jgi:LysM domain
MEKLIWVIVLCLGTQVWARPYRFYLDSDRIEQQLSQFSEHPRLSDEGWLKLINFDKNEQRQIQPGDSLWSIAQGRFGNPFLWRKLWQQNPWITNPHELEVGKILAYYREGQEVTKVKKIPIVKLRPDGVGKISDVDNDIYVNRTMKSRYPVSYIVSKTEDFLGEVTGSFTARTFIGYNDEVYLSFFGDQTVEPGSEFSIVREQKDLRDKTLMNNPILGKLVRMVGQVRILGSDKDLFRAEVYAEFYPLQRGDKIIRIPKIAGESIAEFPAKELIPQVVMGPDEDRAFLGQGELVVLNKGHNQGMREGYLFKVFDDTDPVVKNQDVVTPRAKGEIRVVYVGEDSSVGVINRCQEPVRVGDSLLSFPELPDIPNPPKKLRLEVEVD